MYRKSRVCCPSPWISIGRFAAMAEQKVGMTLAYDDVVGWRGPYTLKIRRTTVSMPLSEAISSQANSPTIFVVAYGEAGAGFCVSTVGVSSTFP